ncbi:MAG: PD40 domain-containing protein [Cyanobacteria bacterium NC_groundwater_1444_Ag_S-0.65um_54_12]|nr:PD40 domain-containing protein [Cyanobacteria bacterium NC_groundwater_1444_Ag_S-0.65um_54_12]
MHGVSALGTLPRALLFGIVPLTMVLGSCNITPSLTIYGIFPTKIPLSVRDSTDITIEAATIPGQTIRYHAVARRGRVIQLNDTSKTFRYYAPYTSRAPDAAGNIVIGDKIEIRISDGFRTIDQSYPITLAGNSLVFKAEGGTGCSNTAGTDCNGPLMVATVDETGLAIRDIKPLADDEEKPLVGTQPVISPDGRRIAYVYYPGNGTSAIYTIDASAQVRNLTGSQLGSGFQVDPSWSPMGNELVFASDRGGNFDIYRSSAEQQGAVAWQITRNPVDERYPSWNPNPQKADSIAVSAHANSLRELGTVQAGAAWNVFLLDIQSGVYTKQLSMLSQRGPYGPDFALEPRWRQDGLTLAYTQRGPINNNISNAARFQRIIVQDTNTNPGGGVPLNPTEQGGPQVGESNPAWNPQGTEIAYLRLITDENGNPTSSQLWKGSATTTRNNGQPAFGSYGPRNWELGNAIPALHLVSTSANPVGGWSLDWR